eukprot:TRINITY_DN17719_c0_g1_i1.p2 TRINITY_DN17719_c0_g1~~TRINITY_DN17719_c0_g1_i1.p2  ORF type:complete len:193 (-),score=24.19 TRINITY_DN17719_c0_g1_i1:60-638(-)
MRTTLLFSLLTFALSVEWQRFDRCDPKWVPLLQDNQFLDCATPGTSNRFLIYASTLTQIANVLATWQIPINGQPTTPNRVFTYSKQKTWRGVDEFLKSLSVNVSKFIVGKDPIENFVASVTNGEGIIITLKATSEAVLVQTTDGKAIEGIDSRGRIIPSDFNSIDPLVMVLKRSTVMAFQLNICIQLSLIHI